MKPHWIELGQVACFCGAALFAGWLGYSNGFDQGYTAGEQSAGHIQPMTAADSAAWAEWRSQDRQSAITILNCPLDPVVTRYGNEVTIVIPIPAATNTATAKGTP